MEGENPLSPAKLKLGKPSRKITDSDLILDVQLPNMNDERQINLHLGPKSLSGSINNKTKFLAVILIVVGIGLIIGGSVAYFVSGKPSSGTTFWIIGGITLVPGIFVTWKLFKIWRNQSYEDKVKIQQEIPGWN